MGFRVIHTPVVSRSWLAGSEPTPPSGSVKVVSGPSQTVAARTEAAVTGKAKTKNFRA
jgi:hypothetical protein